MAFFDWDGDGKKDLFDDIVEYNIYKQSTKNDGDSYGSTSSGNSSGCLGSIAVIGVILLIMFLFVRCTTSYCSVSGCDDECVEDSQYCWLHDTSNRLYGSPTYYRDKQYEREQKKEEPKKEETVKQPPAPPEPPVKNKKTSDLQEDRYNVNDYSNAEDFYDDNYDDFWEYEEAEEYYNKYHRD